MTELKHSLRRTLKAADPTNTTDAGNATPVKPEPRWQRRKAARPGELLEAALALFVERGYAATKLEDVAHRAGVTKGTMYLYFESKEALFKSVVRTNVVPQLERAEQIVAEFHGTNQELLVQLLRGWMEVMYHSPLSGLAKLLVSEAANFPELARFYHEEVVDRAHRILRGVIQRGVESGEFRNLDPDYTTRTLRTPILLAAIWKHSLLKTESCSLDISQYFDTCLDIMLHGVLAAPESPAEKPNA